MRLAVPPAGRLGEHLPPELACPVHYQFCRLHFPETDSEIIGIGEGPDQLRQLTITGILADELGFWASGYDTYVASRPTIEGGGRFTGISTPAPGFFKQLSMDLL